MQKVGEEIRAGWPFACSLLTAQTKEAVITFEMSVNFYKTTQHNIPEDSHLHTRHHGK
jgi:hypothetical protein